jgi:hypothetical protein
LSWTFSRFVTRFASISPLDKTIGSLLLSELLPFGVLDLVVDAFSVIPIHP